jgi:glycosyltransferase involved in cell wall biosynthesis
VTDTTFDSSPLVLTTLLRREGPTGVQSHVRGVVEMGRQQGREIDVVTPFDARSPLLRPVFGARRLVHPASSSAGVWWYREWHRHYLEAALRTHLRKDAGGCTIYAQCPVSAEAALRVRTTERVALAIHFNVSQADEWADKREIARSGRLFEAIRRQEERVLPAVDGLVFVSEFMREAVQARIPSTTTVPSIVMPNFVRAHEGRGAVPDRDLVTVGSLEPRKNQAFLLEVLAAAARRGHRHTLTVVGDGPDRMALAARARALGVDDLVEFTGHAADPRACIRRHRLYCHGARMESFGIVLIEAMAEGLPVVAAPVGGIPEIVRPGENGELWQLDDVEGAADVLIRLLSDREHLESLGHAARASVRTRFAENRVVPRLLAWLDELDPRPASQ